MTASRLFASCRICSTTSMICRLARQRDGHPNPARSTIAQNALPMSDIVNLQHFIPVVIDDLDRDLPRLRRCERPTRRRVERRRRVFVDLGSQRAFQLVVWLVGTGEGRVAGEEGFPVVVRVDNGSW